MEPPSTTWVGGWTLAETAGVPEGIQDRRQLPSASQLKLTLQRFNPELSIFNGRGRCLLGRESGQLAAPSLQHLLELNNGVPLHASPNSLQARPNRLPPELVSTIHGFNR